MGPELKVISDFYDFALYLVQRIEAFPRHHRYSLGIAMENRLQEILALLLRAKYIHDKAPFLREANIELEVLRFQVRMASDLDALPPTRLRARLQVVVRDRGGSEDVASAVGRSLPSRARSC